MKKELEAKLIERFPQYFVDMYGDPSKTCMACGCECGDGWFDLIFKLCEDIEKLNALNFKAEQIKEKFGGLRFYYCGGVEDTSKKYIFTDVRQLVSKAEDDSYETCECCGSKENVTSEGNWITTLCDKCRKPK